MTALDRMERALSPRMGPALAEGICDLLAFGLKEAAACSFATSFLILLALSPYLSLPGLARYDILFLGAVGIQAGLVALRLETPREVAVLFIFHLIGLALEMFKTAPGVHSWSYPEPALFKLATVPLYSGFMYAAVASYTLQAWRLLHLRVEGFPPLSQAIGLSALVYANFFTNHYILDLRWPLAAAVVWLFRHTRVHFTARRRERAMPLALSFLLIGLFIWIAENIATLFGAWVYPHQVHGWALVSASKVSSWTLLVIISVIIVTALRPAQGGGR